MAITEAQRVERQRYIGASDVATILGQNRYQSPTDLWLAKTGQLEPEPLNSEAIEIGNDFERPLLTWAERRIGKPLEYDCPTLVHKGGILCTHLDSRVIEDNAPVEGKVSSLAEEWGDESTDVVPAMYMIQLQTQMLICGSDHGYIAAFLGGFRLSRRLYRIPFNAEMGSLIEDIASEWWDRHVIKGEMPDAAPSLDVVKRIKHRPGLVVPVNVATAEAFVKANEARKAAEKEEEACKARLLAELGGADGGDCPGFEIIVKSVNVKAESQPRPARVDRRLTCKVAG